MMEGRDLKMKIEEFDKLMKPVPEKRLKYEEILEKLMFKLRSTDSLFEEIKFRQVISFYIIDLLEFVREDMEQYVKYCATLDLLKWQTMEIESTIEDFVARESLHRLITVLKDELIANMHSRSEHATKFMEKYKIDNPIDTYSEDISMMVMILMTRYERLLPDLEITMVSPKGNKKRAENILDYLKTMFDFDK